MGMTRRHGHPVRGLALIAVLWIVAALSILVLGMSHTVRNEVRTTAALRESTLAAGWGDAALQLVLQELAIQRPRPTRRMQIQTQYQGASIEVTVQPTTGLIDLNNATTPLLTSLFAVAGGLPPAAAQQAALAILAARSGNLNGRARPTPFEATEDLLGIPGVDYPLYARISRLITVDGMTSGRVDALAAPLEVLVVLADGNVANAMRIATAREAGQAGIDTATTLNNAYLATAAPKRYRLDARVGLADGRLAVFSRTVDLEDGLPDGLPWRTLQTQRWMELPPNLTN
jgi:general secretion pathway protein K